MKILASLGFAAMGLCLLGLAAATFVAPVTTATMYGLPVEKAFEGWVMATGLRDGVLGIYSLYLARHATNRLPFLLCLLPLPLGDAGIVLGQGGAFSAAIVHLAGVVAISALAAVVFISQRAETSLADPRTED